MKSAVAYLRWSLDRQDLSGSAQRAAIERWAASNDVTIVSWHEDAGVSGGADLEDRPGLMSAIDAAPRRGLLVVAKIDRLARDVFTSALVERLCSRKGVEVASADGAGNGSGPEAALMRSLLSSFAAYERALIRARTKAALRAKKDRGERTGSVPYGFVCPDGVSLVPCEDEQVVVRRVKALRADGVSLRRIGYVLVDEGWLSRKGLPFIATQVRRMLVTT